MTGGVSKNMRCKPNGAVSVLGPDMVGVFVPAPMIFFTYTGIKNTFSQSRRATVNLGNLILIEHLRLHERFPAMAKTQNWDLFWVNHFDSIHVTLPNQGK